MCHKKICMFLVSGQGLVIQYQCHTHQSCSFHSPVCIGVSKLRTASDMYYTIMHVLNSFYACASRVALPMRYERPYLCRVVN